MTDERSLLTAYVDRLLRGDREIVNNVSSIISSYFVRFGGNRCGDPDNLKGEVLSALVHNLRGNVFKGENLRQLNAYLRSIVLNTILRDIELQRRFDPIDDQDAVVEERQDGSEVLANKDLAQFVLEHLHPPCREILTLKYMNDLDYSEIAEKLKLREVTVRVRVYRCTECAKQILRNNGLL